MLTCLPSCCLYFFTVFVFPSFVFPNNTSSFIQKIQEFYQYDDSFELRKYIIDLPDNKRLEIARSLIGQGNLRLAYDVLVKHHTTFHKDKILYTKLEWFSGFLSLTKLSNTNNAIYHFKNVMDCVCTPIEKSKALFWLGFSFQKQGNILKSLFYFCASSQFSTTFYGQLSQIFMQRFCLKWPLKIMHSVFFKDCFSFSNISLTQMFTFLLSSLLQTKTDTVQNDKNVELLIEYYKNFPDYVARMSLLVSLFCIDPFLRVRVYKKFFQDYQVPSFLGYPLLNELIPNSQLETLYSTISGDSFHHDFIKTLSHAIILNESEFNYRAESCAGAQGMMQLMQGTASDEIQKLIRKKLVSREDLFDINRPLDNLIVGSSHLKTLVESFKTNIVLISAAYNAGQGNVNKWLKIFGDPRTSKISSLEWMELIPFNETRYYVQRVIESFVVYSYLLNTEYLQNLVWSLF